MRCVHIVAKKEQEHFHLLVKNVICTYTFVRIVSYHTTRTPVEMDLAEVPGTVMFLT